MSEKDSGDSPPSQRLREIVRTHVPKDAAAWFAADSVEWTKKPLLQTLLKAQTERFPLLAKSRAAGIGLSFGESPRLSIALQCDTPETGEKLRTYFKGKATGEHSTSGGAADWATLELAAEPKDIFTTVKAFLDDAGGIR